MSCLIIYIQNLLFFFLILSSLQYSLFHKGLKNHKKKKYKYSHNYTSSWLPPLSLSCMQKQLQGEDSSFVEFCAKATRKSCNWKAVWSVNKPWVRFIKELRGYFFSLSLSLFLFCAYMVLLSESLCCYGQIVNLLKSSVCQGKPVDMEVDFVINWNWS